jgi:hypothetical protein
LFILRKALSTPAPARSGGGPDQNYYYETPNYPTSYYRTADSFYITPTSEDEFLVPNFDSSVLYYITEASSSGSVVSYYITPASDVEKQPASMSDTAHYYREAKHSAASDQSLTLSSASGSLCDPAQNRFPAEAHWASRKEDGGYYQRPRKPLMESMGEFVKTMLQGEGEQGDFIRVKKKDNISL